MTGLPVVDGQGRNRTTDTRIFSPVRAIPGLINQPLAALASPVPRHTKAQLRHTQSWLGTFLAHRHLRLHRYDFAVLADIVDLRRRRLHFRNAPMNRALASIYHVGEFAGNAADFPRLYCRYGRA